MKTHKMTKWDEGQILIKASDCLFECASELRETQPVFADLLKEMALTIGDHFNNFDSHNFGLRSHEDCPVKTTDNCLHTNKTFKSINTGKRFREKYYICEQCGIKIEAIFLNGKPSASDPIQ